MPKVTERTCGDKENSEALSKPLGVVELVFPGLAPSVWGAGAHTGKGLPPAGVLRSSGMGWRIFGGHPIPCGSLQPHVTSVTGELNV